MNGRYFDDTQQDSDLVQSDLYDLFLHFQVGERSVKGTVLQLLYHVRELNMLLRRRDNLDMALILNFVTSGRILMRMVGLTVWGFMSLVSESSGH